MSWAASVLIDERERNYVGSVDVRKQGERRLRELAGRHLAETLPVDETTAVKLSISEHPVRYPDPHRGETELRIDVETQRLPRMQMKAHVFDRQTRAFIPGESIKVNWIKLEPWYSRTNPLRTRVYSFSWRDILYHKIGNDYQSFASSEPEIIARRLTELLLSQRPDLAGVLPVGLYHNSPHAMLLEVTHPSFDEVSMYEEPPRENFRTGPQDAPPARPITPLAEVAVDHLTDMLTEHTPPEEILAAMQSYLDKAKDEVREGREGWDTGVRYAGRRLLIEGERADGQALQSVLHRYINDRNDDLGRDVEPLGEQSRVWISQ